MMGSKVCDGRCSSSQGYFSAVSLEYMKRLEVLQLPLEIMLRAITGRTRLGSSLLDSEINNFVDYPKQIGIRNVLVRWFEYILTPISASLSSTIWCFFFSVELM